MAGLPTPDQPQPTGPEAPTSKAGEVKPVEKPIGPTEQGIVQRIDQDGDPDTVLKDISEIEISAPSSASSTPDTSSDQEDFVISPEGTLTPPSSTEKSEYRSIRDSAEEAENARTQSILDFDPEKEAELRIKAEENSARLRTNVQGILDPYHAALTIKALDEQRAGRVTSEGLFSRTSFRAHWWVNEPPHFAKSDLKFKQAKSGATELKEYDLKIEDRQSVGMRILGGDLPTDVRLKIKWNYKGQDILVLDLSQMQEHGVKDPAAKQQRLVQWLGDNKLTQFIGEVEPILGDGTVPPGFNPTIEINLIDPAIVYRSGFNQLGMYYNPSTDGFDRDILHKDLAANLTSRDFSEVVRSTIGLIPANKI